MTHERGRSPSPGSAPAASARANTPAQVRLVKSVSEIGRLRMRFPVTAKIALHTAGATGGVPGSPIPPQRAPLLSVRYVSIRGASAIRTIGYVSKLPCSTAPFLIVIASNSAAVRP